MKRSFVYALTILCLCTFLCVQLNIVWQPAFGDCACGGSPSMHAFPTPLLARTPSWWGQTTNVEPLDAYEPMDNAVLEQKSVDFLRDEIEGELFNVGEKLLDGSMTKEEIEPILRDFYESMDAAALVYVLGPSGIIEAIYPPKYDTNVGSYFIPDFTSGLTRVKITAAREPMVSKEYISSDVGILGYDFIQPIISTNGQYHGALIAKLSSAGLDRAVLEQFNAESAPSLAQLESIHTNTVKRLVPVLFLTLRVD